MYGLAGLTQLPGMSGLSNLPGLSAMPITLPTGLPDAAQLAALTQQLPKRNITKLALFGYVQNNDGSSSVRVGTRMFPIVQVNSQPNNGDVAIKVGPLAGLFNLNTNADGTKVQVGPRGSLFNGATSADGAQVQLGPRGALVNAVTASNGQPQQLSVGPLGALVDAMTKAGR